MRLKNQLTKTNRTFKTQKRKKKIEIKRPMRKKCNFIYVYQEFSINGSNYIKQAIKRIPWHKSLNSRHLSQVQIK